MMSRMSCFVSWLLASGFDIIYSLGHDAAPIMSLIDILPESRSNPYVSINICQFRAIRR